MYKKRFSGKFNVIECCRRLFVGCKRKEADTIWQRYDDEGVEVSTTFCGLTNVQVPAFK